MYRGAFISGFVNIFAYLNKYANNFKTARYIFFNLKFSRLTVVLHVWWTEGEELNKRRPSQL